MKTIDLKKYYYPICRKAALVELPDEVADAIVEAARAENANDAKQHYHCYSLDASPGIENHSPEQAVSPEDILMEEETEREQEAARAQMIERLREALATLTPGRQAACTPGSGRTSRLRRLPRPRASLRQRPLLRFAMPSLSCRNILSNAAGWSRQRRSRYAPEHHRPSGTEKRRA